MEKEYTLGLYEKAMPERLSWKEKLEAAKAAGFDFVEVSIDETDEKLSRLDMSQAERMEMLNLMRIVGIPIRTMCLSGHRKYPLGSHEEKIRQKSMEIMKKAFSLQMILVSALSSWRAMMSIMKNQMRYPEIILSGI